METWKYFVQYNFEKSSVVYIELLQSFRVAESKPSLQKVKSSPSCKLKSLNKVSCTMVVHCKYHLHADTVLIYNLQG